MKTETRVALTDRWMEWVARIKPANHSDEYLIRLTRVIPWIVARSRARG